MSEARQPQATPKLEGVDHLQRNWGPLRDIPFTLTVEVGRTKLKVRDIIAIEPGSLIVTTKLSGEPMDVSLRNEIFARAEIIIIKDKLWARLTKIIGGDR